MGDCRGREAKARGDTSVTAMDHEILVPEG